MKRREAVKLIAITGIAGTGTAVAQHQGHGVKQAPAAAKKESAARKALASAYRAKYFSEHEFAVITRLADLIIPRDSTPGALDARAHEYIDLQVAEMPETQVRLSGGIQWLDRYCAEQFGQPFLKCTEAQQKSVLDRLAYAKTVTAGLRAARAFFATVRDLTCDGFYSSKLGYTEVGYKGNTFVTKFVGCTHPEHEA